MSDFTDDEDRQLVQLALVYSQHNVQIAWDQLARQMVNCKHDKDALRQRLKTLKRTNGCELRDFRPWYFKKYFHNAVNTDWLYPRSIRSRSRSCTAHTTKLDSKPSATENKKPRRKPLLHHKKTKACCSNRQFWLKEETLDESTNNAIESPLHLLAMMALRMAQDT